MIQNPQAPTVTDPSWLQLLERLGLPVFLILFGCMIVWKLLPYMIEWFKTSILSQKAVAQAVPEIEESLKKLANDGQTKLNDIDARTKEILERLPAK